MKNEKNHFDVVIIGGGASGMMAAGVAASRGKRVAIIEKNKKLGKKLDITGGGRCNITNDESDQHKLLSKYGDAQQYLYSPFSQFSVRETFSFFEKRGLPIVVESRGRAFPKTQDAKDVTNALRKFLSENNVTIITDTPIVVLKSKDGKISEARSTEQTFTANSFIVATGGTSHPETGSTGDGFKWLYKLGHTIKKSSPNIVPLATSEKWGHALSGTSLSFMKISFYVNGKKAFSEVGKILFTHFGISGPLILNCAHRVADLLHEGDVTAYIDAFPDTEIGTLEKSILKIIDANKNKDFVNVFKEIAPRGTSDGIITLLSIDADKKAHSVTKEERSKIAHTLKALSLTITGLMGFDRAVVSDGGLILDEVDTKTMRSNIYNNLYLTGDILHINRPSGGYSLQLCWTTGYVAGMNS
jgi:predicted Rossmann fold flavoprotein